MKNGFLRENSQVVLFIFYSRLLNEKCFQGDQVRPQLMMKVEERISCLYYVQEKSINLIQEDEYVIFVYQKVQYEIFDDEKILLIRRH
jgi:hypothetical protein